MHSHGSDRSRPHVEMARSLRGAVAWTESRVGTLRGGATVFALALGVFGVRSIALPVIPGRDFGTYIGYYVQMWDWHSVVPMSQLYRTPLPPLVIGGTLDLLGGWGLEVVMALLFAASLVAWTRTAFAFGPRPALLTAVALLVYPGYGILFHTPASRTRRRCRVRRLGARGRAGVDRADVRTIRGRRRSDCSGRARAPGIPGPRARLGAAPPLSHALERSARVRRGVCRRRSRRPRRVDSRERAPVRRLHRCARDRRVLPVLSRLHDRPHRPSGQRARLAELADAVRRDLLPEEPYRSYGITLDDFFERGGPREFEDVVGITDRLWGWDSDYAHMRAVGIEAVRAHPVEYISGVGKTTFEELWKPLFVALPNDPAEAPTAPAQPNDTSQPATGPGLPVPTDGEVIPSAHQGFFSTTPDGHIRERWTSPVDHTLVFSTQEMQQRYDQTGRDAGALLDDVPPYGGNEWLTLQFSRSSKLFPPPILWLVAALSAWSSGGRRGWFSRSRWPVPPRSSSAPRRSPSTRSSSSHPLAPALIVLGAAGLVGTRSLDRTRA